MKLAYCARGIYVEHQWAIHAAGCADIARREVREHAAHVTDMEADSAAALRERLVAELNADINDGDDGGWCDDDIRIYPCCKA